MNGSINRVVGGEEGEVHNGWEEGQTEEKEEDEEGVLADRKRRCR